MESDEVFLLEGAAEQVERPWTKFLRLPGAAGVAAVVLLFYCSHSSVVSMLLHARCKALKGKASSSTKLAEGENCGGFSCPDGFRLKEGAEEIRGHARQGLCCEEALCSCSFGSNSSKFTCSFEVADTGCASTSSCALDPSRKWRYFTDRYSACERRDRLGATNASLHSFYLYRSGPPHETFLDGMDAANAVGAIIRLHLERITHRLHAPDRFGVTRLRRLKVQIRATAPLLQRHMDFGPLSIIDGGQCEGFIYGGTGFCSAGREKYGSVVGCKMIFEHPVWGWGDPTGGCLAKDAIWYSLPGPCSDHLWNHRTAACVEKDPGGRCEGVPSGAEDCSFSVEPAGEIGINELAGIEDYESFYNEGGREYDETTDR